MQYDFYWLWSELFVSTSNITAKVDIICKELPYLGGRGWRAKLISRDSPLYEAVTTSCFVFCSNTGPNEMSKHCYPGNLSGCLQSVQIQGGMVDWPKIKNKKHQEIFRVVWSRCKSRVGWMISPKFKIKKTSGNLPGCKSRVGWMIGPITSSSILGQ